MGATNIVVFCVGDEQMCEDLKQLLRAGGYAVLTGEMENSSRMTVMEVLEAMGLFVSGSVSRRTSFLIAGSGPKQIKIEKAKQLGVPILSEADFWAAVDEVFPSEN